MFLYDSIMLVLSNSIHSTPITCLTSPPLGTNGIRKLRDGLPCRWPLSSIGSVGYGRTRRLWTLATISLLKSPCPLDWVLCGYSWFVGECETQGSSQINWGIGSHTDFRYSGSTKQTSDAPEYRFFWLDWRKTFVKTHWRLKKCARNHSSSWQQKRAVISQRRLEPANILNARLWQARVLMMYSKQLPVLHCSRSTNGNRLAVWLSDDAIWDVFLCQRSVFLLTWNLIDTTWCKPWRYQSVLRCIMHHWCLGGSCVHPVDWSGYDVCFPVIFSRAFSLQVFSYVFPFWSIVYLWLMLMHVQLRIPLLLIVQFPEVHCDPAHCVLFFYVVIPVPLLSALISHTLCSRPAQGTI